MTSFTDPAAEPVFSTWSAKNRHLTAGVWPDPSSDGSRGRSVCGHDIYSQVALDKAYQGYKPPPRFTDLPLCTKCARKAERDADVDARTFNGAGEAT